MCSILQDLGEMLCLFTEKIQMLSVRIGVSYRDSICCKRTVGAVNAVVLLVLRQLLRVEPIARLLQTGTQFRV